MGYCGSVKRCSPGVWFGFLLAPLLHAQMTVQVTHTPTQAVLSYVAPSDSLPCRVQISQSRRMTPLVPDVDPNLFEGADLDSRSGSVSIGSGGRLWRERGEPMSPPTEGVTRVHYRRPRCTSIG